MIKNKKSQEFLGEHVMNLVIAAISIVVLLLLAVGIVNIFLRQSGDLQKAEGTLQSIMDSINSLKNEGDSKTFPVYNPVGWAINYQDNVGVVGGLPTSCAGEKCICICKYSENAEEFFKNCNGAKTGVCSKFSKFVMVEPYCISGEVCQKVIKINKILNIHISVEKYGSILIKEIL